MTEQTFDSRVINGVRIYRAVIWDGRTRKSSKLHSSSREQLQTQVARLLAQEDRSVGKRQKRGCCIK